MDWGADIQPAQVAGGSRGQRQANTERIPPDHSPELDLRAFFRTRLTEIEPALRDLPAEVSRDHEGPRHPRLAALQLLAVGLSSYDVAVLFGQRPFEQAGMVRGAQTVLRNPQRSSIIARAKAAQALEDALSASQEAVTNPQRCGALITKVRRALARAQTRTSDLGQIPDLVVKGIDTRFQDRDVMRALKNAVERYAESLPDKLPWLFYWRVHQMVMLLRLNIAKSDIEVDDFGVEMPRALHDASVSHGGLTALGRGEAQKFREGRAAHGWTYSSPGHRYMTEGRTP